MSSFMAILAFYEACDVCDFYFLVRLKDSARLGQLADLELQDGPLNINDAKAICRDSDYQRSSWTQPYHFIVNSIHNAIETIAETHTLS